MCFFIYHRKKKRTYRRFLIPQLFLILLELVIIQIIYISRHTIVCRATQEAGVPHREYIDSKKENVIFTLLYLGDSLSD